MLITNSKNPFNILLCLMMLLISVNHCYGQKSEELQNIQTSKDQSYREIHGYITNANLPLVNVNISANGTDRGAKTDSKGFYTIKAKEGEVLLFTYIGMQSVEVIIEDVTEVLNIKMRIKENSLGEVIVKANRKQKAGFTEMGKPKNITK